MRLHGRCPSTMSIRSVATPGKASGFERSRPAGCSFRSSRRLPAGRLSPYKAFYNRLARASFVTFMHQMLARLIEHLSIQTLTPAGCTALARFKDIIADLLREFNHHNGVAVAWWWGRAGTKTGENAERSPSQHPEDRMTKLDHRSRMVRPCKEAVKSPSGRFPSANGPIPAPRRTAAWMPWGL